MTLIEAFRTQAEICENMGSPFTARVLEHLAECWPRHGPLYEALRLFDGDLGPGGHSLPLRVVGGLHAVVLQNADPVLAEVYPPNDPRDEELRNSILHALVEHQDFLVSWVQNPPQTNEVRRSAALIAGAHVVRAQFDLPYIVSELGASGGLNLNWDQYAVKIHDQVLGPTNPVIMLEPRWTGAIPPVTSPVIKEKSGVDLTPLDPQNPDDLLRMLSYVWADQSARLSRTKTAAVVQSVRIAQGDAIAWLAERLKRPRPGHVHFVQHTVAWQYFPAPTQRAGLDLLIEAGARATADAPLAWMRMESDGGASGQPGAALTLRIWPGDHQLNLGRADFHGRWIDWRVS